MTHRARRASRPRDPSPRPRSRALVILLVRHGARLVHDLTRPPGGVLRGRAPGLLVLVVLSSRSSSASTSSGSRCSSSSSSSATPRWTQKVADVGRGPPPRRVSPGPRPVRVRVRDLVVADPARRRGAPGVAVRPARSRQPRSGEEHRRPTTSDIRFLLGRLYQALGQNDRAISEYTAGAQLAPRDSRCLVNRGNIRFVDGDLGFGPGGLPAGAQARSASRSRPATTSRCCTPRRSAPSRRRRRSRRRAPWTPAPSRASRTRPTLVKVVSIGYTPDGRPPQDRGDGARGPQSRRLLGHFRYWDPPRRLPACRSSRRFLVAVAAAWALDLFRTAGPRLRVGVPEVRARVLPPLQALHRERAPVLAVHPRVPEEGRRRDRDEAPEARGRAAAQGIRGARARGPEHPSARAPRRSSTRASSVAAVALRPVRLRRSSRPSGGRARRACRGRRSSGGLTRAGASGSPSPSPAGSSAP